MESIQLLLSRCCPCLCGGSDEDGEVKKTDDDVITIKTTLVCCVKTDNLHLDVCDTGPKNDGDIDDDNEKDL